MIGKKHKPFYAGQHYQVEVVIIGEQKSIFFDPDLLPQGQSLQLEPWEYERGVFF